MKTKGRTQSSNIVDRRSEGRKTASSPAAKGGKEAGKLAIWLDTSQPGSSTPNRSRRNQRRSTKNTDNQSKRPSPFHPNPKVIN